MGEPMFQSTSPNAGDTEAISLKKINKLLENGIPFSGSVNVGALQIEGGTGGLVADVVDNGTHKVLVVAQDSQPLPTGAATSARQDLAKTVLDNILTELNAKTEPANQQHVIIDSAANPTGGATAALQTSGNASLTLVDANLGAKADAAATTDTGVFSLIALMKRLLTLTSTGVANVISKATASIRSYFALGTFVQSVAYENGHVIKASAGNGIRVSGHSSYAAQQWIQVHDSATEPADTAVPKITRYVLIRDNFNIDLTGIVFANGIYVCNSVTGPTKTIGAANTWFEGLYE